MSYCLRQDARPMFEQQYLHHTRPRWSCKTIRRQPRWPRISRVVVFRPSTCTVVYDYVHAPHHLTTRPWTRSLPSLHLLPSTSPLQRSSLTARTAAAATTAAAPSHEPRPWRWYVLSLSSLCPSVDCLMNRPPSVYTNCLAHY